MVEKIQFHFPMSDPSAVPPQEALQRLKEGNQRFVEGRMRNRDLTEIRATLHTSQHPYAIVVGCSDSRVPPELVFDKGLGQLFTVRVAGNYIDHLALGSIGYGIGRLGARLLVVLGHENCGVVLAALQGGDRPANIAALLERMIQTVEHARERNLEEEVTVSAMIEENVRLQMKAALRQSEILRELVTRGEFLLVGGVYDVETGAVRFLEAPESTESASERAAAAR